MLVETELKKLEKFDAAYFRGKNYFDGDGTQNYLVFQSMYKYFKKFTKNNSTFISSWESKGLSKEKINSINTSSSNFSPTFACDNARIKLKFNGDFLRQDDLATYNHGKMVNIYIVYRLTPTPNDTSITLKNCPFGAVEEDLILMMLINTFILNMELDLIRIQVWDMAEMLLSLGLI